YEHGLQRERFLPAIDLIKKHTKVWRLSLQEDYRCRTIQYLTAYYTPWGEAAEQALWNTLLKLTENHRLTQKPLILYDREIVVKQRTDKVIWFEFNIICGRPRSQNDYLALAEQYSVVLISHVPCLEMVSKDKLVSFIHLVDIFYDSRVKLILSAAVPITKLYTQGSFRHIFQRTESRLMQMQHIVFSNVNMSLKF
ncbi:MAG TPA: cell division protein ZapE, partial [Cyclobacteriaceae bacterium]|nr:cell division protein ZapE [Cyclobacteriaceae bacterium]